MIETILGILWFLMMGTFFSSRLFGWPIPGLQGGPILFGADDPTEFQFPYEIVSMRGFGSNFTYRYLGALIDVMVFWTPGKRRVAALRIHRPFSDNMVIRKNYGLLSQVTRVFPVSPWGRKGRRSKAELVLTNKDVCRLLSTIPEFELILISKANLIAARYVAAGDYTPESLCAWAGALYNIHVYGQKVLEHADFPLEAASLRACCPFCREEVMEADGRTCEQCGTLHHGSCWVENNGCAVFGCRQRAEEQGASMDRVI